MSFFNLFTNNYNFMPYNDLIFSNFESYNTPANFTSRSSVFEGYFSVPQFSFSPILSNFKIPTFSNFMSGVLGYSSPFLAFKAPSLYINSGQSLSQETHQTYTPSKTSGQGNNKYLKFKNTQDAINAAKNDPNLEDISKGGAGWSISSDSFKTDIPFAKKGTGKILDLICKKINKNLVITSALATGTPNNPHKISTNKSHHNADNPKLDILYPPEYKNDHAGFEKLLLSTGYFCHTLKEGDHIDVQISNEAYQRLYDGTLA